MSQSLEFCISVAPNMAAFMDLSLHVRSPPAPDSWNTWSLAGVATVSAGLLAVGLRMSQHLSSQPSPCSFRLMWLSEITKNLASEESWTPESALLLCPEPRSGGVWGVLSHPHLGGLWADLPGAEPLRAAA